MVQRERYIRSPASAARYRTPLASDSQGTPTTEKTSRQARHICRAMPCRPVFGSGDGRGVSTSWIKIKNPNCTRMIGRREPFEARRDVRQLNVAPPKTHCHAEMSFERGIAALRCIPRLLRFDNCSLKLPRIR